MSYKIEQTNNKIVVTLIETNHVFLKSIQVVIPGSVVNQTGNKLFFHASNIRSLFDYLKTGFLSYEQTLILVGHLTSQIMYLNERQLEIIGFDLNDILVVGDSLFFIASPQNIFLVDKNASGSNILFELPFYKPEFISPAIKTIMEIPSQVSYLETRYSLAILIVRCLGVGIEMDEIKYTRLYWFLSRCFAKVDGPMILI
jgi:hypothetical protein